MMLLVHCKISLPMSTLMHNCSTIISCSQSRRRKVWCQAQPKVEDAQLAIAHRLGLQYMILQRPAMHNVRYSTAMADFTNIAILAYECGYTEDTVKQEMQAAPMQDLDLDECLLYVSLTFITLSLSPSRTVVRWAKGDPVSEATMNLWKGFVSLILAAYFEKRMAWFPVDRLQMEVSAMTGRLERPSTIAEFARLVYSTLNTVAPQFPASWDV